MDVNPTLINKHKLIAPEYELYNVFNFAKWENISLHLLIDEHIEKVIDHKKLRTAFDNLE